MDGHAQERADPTHGVVAMCTGFATIILHRMFVVMKAEEPFDEEHGQEANDHCKEHPLLPTRIFKCVRKHVQKGNPDQYA